MPQPLPDPISEVLTEEQSGYSETTLRVYRAAWRDFLGWARSARASVLDAVPSSLPPGEVVSEYLRKRSDLAWSTLASRRQALRLVYDTMGEKDPFTHPEVDQVWSTILRKKRNQPDRPAKRRLDEREEGITSIIEEGPKLLRAHLNGISGDEKRDLRYLPKQVLTPEWLTPDQKKLIPEVTYDLQLLRNRALLLLVAMGSLTRSEVTGIDLEDVYPPEEEGGPTTIVVYNQAGTLRCVLLLETTTELRWCPNRAVAAWILAADLTEGPLFRSFTPHGELAESRLQPQTINHIIKRFARKAGLDPKEWSMTRLREDEHPDPATD